MFAPEVLGPAVDRLATLAGEGRALEFAVGTGRVAVPLAGRGVPVTGIELSQPMVERLRTKADEPAIPVIIGDLASATAPGKYTLVYLVYNTMSNLLSQAEQVACFRNAARHLVPGGRFVIELGVPEQAEDPASPGVNGLDILAKPLANGDVSVVLFNETGSAATIGTTAAAIGKSGASTYTWPTSGPAEPPPRPAPSAPATGEGVAAQPVAPSAIVLSISSTRSRSSAANRSASSFSASSSSCDISWSRFASPKSKTPMST